MKKKEPISPKEENFCRFFVASREPRASAARAGYSVHPERTAMKLLADPSATRSLRRSRRATAGSRSGALRTR